MLKRIYIFGVVAVNIYVEQSLQLYQGVSFSPINSATLQNRSLIVIIKKIYSCYTGTHYKLSTSLKGREKSPFQQGCLFPAIPQQNHSAHMSDIYLFIQLAGTSSSGTDLRNAQCKRGRGPLPGSLQQAQRNDTRADQQPEQDAASCCFTTLTQEMALLVSFPYILDLRPSLSTKRN